MRKIEDAYPTSMDIRLISVNILHRSVNFSTKSISKRVTKNLLNFLIKLGYD